MFIQSKNEESCQPSIQRSYLENHEEEVKQTAHRGNKSQCNQRRARTELLRTGRTNRARKVRAGREGELNACPERRQHGWNDSDVATDDVSGTEGTGGVLKEDIPDTRCICTFSTCRRTQQEPPRFCTDTGLIASATALPRKETKSSRHSVSAATFLPFLCVCTFLSQFFPWS